MMTHDKVIEVIQAHKEGKPIEWLSKKSKWESCEQVSLEIILHNIINNEINYRIAPEPPKPEYVPFESMEEFMPHCDKWVRVKGQSELSRVILLNNNGLHIDGSYYDWKRAFNYLEFSDGTPCGKLVEK